MNITYNEESERFSSTEQVIFLCVKMGRYNGPGGSIVTTEINTLYYSSVL